MSSHSHPCCEKNVNQPAQVATVQQSHVLHVAFTAVMFVVRTSDSPTEENSSRRLTLGLPPPAPPNLNSILRI